MIYDVTKPVLAVHFSLGMGKSLETITQILDEQRLLVLRLCQTPSSTV